MFKLIIKRTDGTVYWVDYFNSLAQAQAWILVEQTQSYWDLSYTHEITDYTPTPHIPDYKELRAKAYPPITDYLDSIVKGDVVQAQTYIAACLAVKAKYPKGAQSA